MWKQTIGFKSYQKIHYDKESKNQKIHQPQRNIIILVMKFLQILFHNAEIDTFILEFEKITFYTVNR